MKTWLWGNKRLLPPQNREKNVLLRERGSFKSLSDQGGGWAEKAKDRVQFSHSAKHGMEGMFSSQWAVYFKSASRSIFIKPSRTGVQKALAVPGPWGTGPWHYFVKAFETENKGELLSSFPVWDFPRYVLGTSNSKAHSDQWPWIFTGLCRGWFRKSSKLSYCWENSVGSDALLLVFVIDYAAGPGSCSHHTFPSPKKKQAGCKAGAVHRGPCWLF